MSKHKFIEFCNSRTDIPFFFRPQWLNVFTSLEWDVILYEEEQNNVTEIEAFFVFFHRKILGKREIVSAVMNPFSGIWQSKRNFRRNADKMKYENELYKYFIRKLPSFANFYLSFSPEISNWFPFFLSDFSCTPGYTFVVPPCPEQDLNFSKAVKNNLKRAKKNGLKIIEEKNTNILYKLIEKTFKRQKLPVPFPKDLLHRISEIETDKFKSRIFVVKDETAKTYSAKLIMEDDLSYYALIGGSDADLRKYGSDYLLYDFLIKEAHKNNKHFDFCGSMLEHIQNRIRFFNPERKIFFHIYKNNSNLLKIYGKLRKLKHTLKI